ncbi:MAG TPA: lysophospholipid acyltransferase family protein [Lacibacter sp.]|nr:lysophospholipid acyltransferase family protein [Lacibacter sp.]HMO88125.1 lysophospholipid acyltransferase family protein [Lacibacter sp.]HMP86781.1 lysophospholipid acyltransferase family protein [Lacibacter sp.]
MYYLVYFLLKALSLLPLRVLYLLSDTIYVLMVYVFGYRRSIVEQNLLTAFPEKSATERRRILKAFYHNLCDTFVEIIKLLSWDREEILRRMEGNISLLNAREGGEQSVQLMSGHFFNWEIANLAVAARCRLPFLGVYMPLTSKVMDRIFRDFRTKTGTILIPATDFKNNAGEYLRKQYALILVGDQNPGNPGNAWWLHFFDRPAPFVKGPAKGAISRNTVVLYADFYKIKRGYYRFDIELVTDQPGKFTEEELTRLLVRRVEASVRQRPDNYLWSHRRWKHSWKPEYSTNWIDTTPPPAP